MKQYLLLAICALSLASCTEKVYEQQPYKNGPPPHAKAWGVKKKQRAYYYYYPTANVYFDVTFGKYVYFSGGSWLRVNSLPASIVISSGERVRINYVEDDVYVYNTDHKNKYKKVPPGQAKKMSYSIYEDDNDHGNGRGKKKKGH